MFSAKKLVIIVAVFLIGYSVVGGPEKRNEPDSDQATGSEGCGSDFKDTVDRLLSDTKACFAELTGQSTEEPGAWARAYFLYDQGRWSVAGQPYHDPQSTKYAADSVSDGTQNIASVEVLDSSGDVVWTGTSQHGDLAVLVVDFADLEGTDRVIVKGADGKTSEVRL